MQPRKTFYGHQQQRSHISKKNLSPPPYSKKQNVQQYCKHILTALSIIADSRPQGQACLLLNRQRTLRESSSRVFYQVLNQLSQQIFGQNIQGENLIQITRLMGYPINIAKSWVTGIGLHHSWNGNLALLSWISQLYLSSLSWDVTKSPSLIFNAQNFLNDKDIAQHIKQVQRSYIQAEQQAQASINQQKHILSKIQSQRKAIQKQKPSLLALQKQKAECLKAQSIVSTSIKQIEKQIKIHEQSKIKKLKLIDSQNQNLAQLIKKKNNLTDRLKRQQLSSIQYDRLNNQISSLNSKLTRLDHINQSNQKIRLNHIQHLQKLTQQFQVIASKLRQRQGITNVFRSNKIGLTNLLNKQNFIYQVTGLTNLSNYKAHWQKQIDKTQQQKEKVISMINSCKQELDLIQLQKSGLLSSRHAYNMKNQQIQENINKNQKVVKAQLNKALQQKKQILVKFKQIQNRIQIISTKIIKNNKTISNLTNQLAELKKIHKQFQIKSASKLKQLYDKSQQFVQQSQKIIKQKLLSQIQLQQELRQAQMNMDM